MAEEEGTESRERIMEATYRALIETGYADLTMSDIAAKSETSTSLLHYHFDTKEDLLVAFLDHGLDRLRKDFEAGADQHPTDRLLDLLSIYVLDPTETDREAFHVAIVELRGQAPYNDRYRARFRRSAEFLTDALVEILEEGQESGVFAEEFDASRIVQLLVATLDGARTRGIALGEPGYTKDVLQTLFQEVLADIFTEEAAERWRESLEE